MNFIESLIVTIILVLCAFSAGELSKKYDKPITAKVPATYSSKQIDNLIQVDALLASKIKQQLDYEQSFSSNH